MNWRDAVPYYEKVLALDPDNVPATLAKVELYEEAGLHDTALALLEARARAPAAERGAPARDGRGAARRGARDRGRRAGRALLGACASTTRPSRARGSSSRWRGATPPTAARWIDRLVATNPDSAGALQTAAQAWMRLGDRARAIAAYRTALDLAPDDTDVMRELATSTPSAASATSSCASSSGCSSSSPQAKDVRDEVAHIEPARAAPGRAVRAPRERVPREARRARRRGRRAGRSSTCR